MFEGESKLVIPSPPTPEEQVILRLDKNTSAELHLKVLVAARTTSSSFYVYDHTLQLPKFCMFQYLDPEQAQQVTKQELPRGYVRFRRPSRYQLLQQWIEKSFVANDGFEKVQDMSSSFSFLFYSLRDGSFLQISCSSREEQVKISTDDIQLASDLVQDMCLFLEVRTLYTFIVIAIFIYIHTHTMNRSMNLNRLQTFLNICKSLKRSCSRWKITMQQD